MVGMKMHSRVAHNGAKVEYEKRGTGGRHFAKPQVKGALTMSNIKYGFLVLAGSIVLATAPCAAAQTAEQNDYDAGKTPAQLFASDCGICHKSPAGLSKVPGMFGLESFLAEHYTASRESAAILAKYLQSVDTGQPAAAPARRAKSGGKSKETKSETRPPERHKPADAEAKSSESGESNGKTEARSDAKSETKSSDATPPKKKDGDKPAKSD